jgi:hypothetical protein
MEITPADSLPCGLSTAEARRRLAESGPNATPDTDIHPLRLVLGKFIAPVPCLLETAIVLQLMLREYVEASIIAVLVVFNAALGLLHEGRAQATVAALKSRSSRCCSVARRSSTPCASARSMVVLAESHRDCLFYRRSCNHTGHSGQWNPDGAAASLSRIRCVRRIARAGTRARSGEGRNLPPPQNGLGLLANVDQSITELESGERVLISIN